MRPSRVLLVLALALAMPALAGCQTVYYDVMEVFGKEKRDLLRAELKGMVGDQNKAERTFTDALEQVKALADFDGGDLEATYDRLKGANDRALDSADAIDSRIGSIQDVAAALFEEWELEIDQIGTAKLRDSSRAKLRDTRARYSAMEKQLLGSRDQMRSVAAVLKDHVLFLKHNLNAAAVGELEKEMADVEESIEDLRRTIEESIREAQQFLADFGE